MSETESDSDSTEVSQPDGATLRSEIRDCVDRHKTITVAEVVTEVSRDCGCPEVAVVEQLDTMEQHGFCYLVGDGGARDAEVRLP
jgi:Flp pilus assembly CpaE family ATPase